MDDLGVTLGQLKKKIIKSYYFYRIAESFVPVLAWLIITFPLWLSPYHPAVASYIILAYLIYFSYKSLRTTYYAAVSYKILKKAMQIDWNKKLIELKGHSKIHHFILITNYKEKASKVAKTIGRIEKQNYAKDKIYVVLAMEEREREEAEKRSKLLTKRFANKFRGFYTTYHKIIPGEVVGKASNEAYATKYIYKVIREKKMDPKNVIITISDADSLLPKDYLAYMTYLFLQDEHRQYRFYWAPVLLYNNFWKLTLPVRMQSILSSILRLSFLSQREDLIQISTYSASLWLIHKVGYWDTDIIPEDWHIWFQAFFKYGEKVKTIPIYLPISGDPIFTGSLISTLKNRYEQEKRWAWGASDIPYAIVKFFETPHIPVRIKLKKILFLMEIHLLWPTSFFVLTLSGWIPPLVNPTFRRTVLGFLLPKLSSLILTITSILFLSILFFDYKIRKKIKIETRMRNIPFLFFQWYLLPIISFLFSSLPALEAHTRLILGKKIEYIVMEKK